MKKNEINIFKWFTIIFFISFMATLVLLIKTEKESKVMEEKIGYLNFKILRLEKDVERYQKDVESFYYDDDSSYYDW